MRKPKIQYVAGGLAAEHDMPCAVCHERPAVLYINEAILEPCWKCQEKGWTLIKVPGWLQSLIRRFR